MTLTLSSDGFRFRILPDELEDLLAGRTVEHRVSAGPQGLSFSIVPVAGEEDLKVEREAHTIRLLAPQTVLERLRDLGRSKEGVSSVKDGVTMCLQVDLKSSVRTAA
ncbi:MAG TPA: hypothetical protein PKX87_09010 [Alphaproteobacteria bacterium]|nr:hypothetical protein [Alphaproteobacteria bacterium]